MTEFIKLKEKKRLVLKEAILAAFTLWVLVSFIWFFTYPLHPERCYKVECIRNDFFFENSPVFIFFLIIGFYFGIKSFKKTPRLRVIFPPFLLAFIAYVFSRIVLWMILETWEIAFLSGYVFLWRVITLLAPFYLLSFLLTIIIYKRNLLWFVAKIFGIIFFLLIGIGGVFNIYFK